MTTTSGTAIPATRQASIIGGVALTAGTAIGAGMFSLPVVAAGMGFFWSSLCLLLTWFCMMHTALLILETNLNYPAGSSFDTFVGQTLGPRWNLLNNASLVFVLYVLCYAFISGGGSIVSQTLRAALDLSLAPMIAGLLFSLATALVVWIGTATVNRVTTIIMAGMILSFGWSVAQLADGMQPALLFDLRADYLVYSFAALPVFLTAFGFHGIVPSLVKHYGKDAGRICKCLVIGASLTLLCYLAWMLVTLGQIPRDGFAGIIAAGGNIGPMVEAIGNRNSDALVLGVLNSFANLAVISSFIGAAIGLFDYVADKFNFGDTHLGRLKSATITFVPPTVASMFFPDGFIIAIGFAGLAAAILALVVPAQAAKVSRRKFGSPLFRVWGGNYLVYFVFGYAALVALCHILAMAGMLPVFGG